MMFDRSQEMQAARVTGKRMSGAVARKLARAAGGGGGTVRGGWMEGLEVRRLFAATGLVSGVVEVMGDVGTRNVISTVWSSDGSRVAVRVNGRESVFQAGQVTGLRVTLGNAGDTVVMDPRMFRPVTVVGGAGHDTIVGGAERDVLGGGGGNDLIRGGSGDDVISGDAGNDTLYGEGGNDRLTGGDGTDFIDGGAGTDTLTTSAGGDTVRDVSVTLGTGGGATNSGAAGGGGNAPKPGIDKLSLWRTDTDQWVADLTPGRVVDLAGLPTTRLTVVASATPGTQSVRFGANGIPNLRVDNGGQYTAGPEDGSDMLTWTALAQGNFDVTATAYSRDNAGGEVSSPFNLTFRVTDSSAGEGVTTGAAVITTTSNRIVAGQAFFASGVGGVLASGSAVTAKYAWDFGDPNGKYNRLVGFNAAHVYDRAGVYTVRLTVTDEAGRATVTTTRVTVAAEARRAVYVSSAGNDANDGSSPERAVKTSGRAGRLVTDDTRVLFRRGDTFVLTEALYVGRSNVEVGAYGSGNVPVLKRGNAAMWELISVGNSAADVVVRDLAFETDTPANLDKSGASRGVTARGARVTIRDCVFAGVSDAINANESPRGLMVMDNVVPTVTSLRGYFVWLQGSDVSVVGNRVANSTREHNVRVGGADRVLLAFNDFGNTSRVSQGDSNDIAKGCFTIQKGSYIYVTRNKARGGGIGVGPLGGVDGRDDPGARTTWVVIDGNEVSDVGLTVTAGAEHVAIRNNVIRRGSDEAIWLRPTDSHVVNGTNIYASRNIRDLTIANNTMVSSGTRGNFLLVSARGAAGQVSLVNNLLVAPNMTAGQSRTAAVYINDTQAGSTAMFRAVSGNVWENLKTVAYAQGGYFYAYAHWSDPAGYLTPAEWASLARASDRFGSVVVDASSYRPGASSTAAAGSRGVAGVFADFHGNARAGTGQAVTAGAVQL